MLDLGARLSGFTTLASPRTTCHLKHKAGIPVAGAAVSLSWPADSELPASLPTGLSGSGWQSPETSEDAVLLSHPCGRVPQRAGQAPFQVFWSHAFQLCRWGSKVKGTKPGLDPERSHWNLSSAVARCVDGTMSLLVWVSASVQGEVPSQAPGSAPQSFPRAGPKFSPRIAALLVSGMTRQSLGANLRGFSLLFCFCKLRGQGRPIKRWVLTSVGQETLYDNPVLP